MSVVAEIFAIKAFTLEKSLSLRRAVTFLSSKVVKPSFSQKLLQFSHVIAFPVQEWAIS